MKDALIPDMVEMLIESRHMSEQTKILRIFARLLKNENFPSLKKEWPASKYSFINTMLKLIL